jgi:putative addiction module component (TIGR02574 family)
MTPTGEELKFELSKLSSQDRAELAAFLIASLEVEDTGVETYWDEELGRRAVDIKNGEVQGEPAELVFARLHRAYSPD